MKPRIRKHHGRWWCISGGRHGGEVRWMAGDTPKMAYQQWFKAYFLEPSY